MIMPLAGTTNHSTPARIESVHGSTSARARTVVATSKR